MREYNILEPVAAGAMGCVYIAFQRSLARRVALKVLSPELVSSPVVKERFLREARVASSLAHPNIVRVFDSGTLDGQPFIAMDLVSGIDLGALVEDVGALPFERALCLMVQAADALAYVHASGLTHRDVKPANLVVDGRDHLTLVDFGLVSAAGMTMLTESGSVLGTPMYFSPESVRSGTYGAAHDVYALALTTHTVLTARLPYDARTLIELIELKLAGVAPSLAGLVPDAPAGLVELQERALAVDPEARPTAAEYRDELTALISITRGPVTSVRPAAPQTMAVSPSSGRRTPWPPRAASATARAARDRVGRLSVHATGVAMGILTALGLLLACSGTPRGGFASRKTTVEARSGSAPGNLMTVPHEISRRVTVRDLTCLPTDTAVLVDLELDARAVIWVEILAADGQVPLSTIRATGDVIQRLIGGLSPRSGYVLRVRSERGQGRLAEYSFVTRAPNHSLTVAELLSGRPWSGRVELGAEFFRVNPDVRAVEFFRRVLGSSPSAHVLPIRKMAEVAGRLRSRELADLLVPFASSQDEQVRSSVVRALAAARHPRAAAIARARLAPGVRGS